MKWRWPVLECGSRRAGRDSTLPFTPHYFPNHHLALTSAIFTLVARTVESGEGQESAGLWHDILWMSRVCPVRLLRGGHTFKIGICAGRALRWYELKILFHDGDYGEPCATVMLPDED